MENVLARTGRLAHFLPLLKVLLIVVTGAVFLGWWISTPPGLLGKADAIGYAVCHRIDIRSFHIGERQTPLCARCSGMYLGGLLGLVYLLPFGKLGGMPPRKIAVILIAFLGAFAVDGANSYLHFFPGAPGVYQPENWLRLVTGTGIGLGIAAVLTPVFHQTVWPVFNPRPALAGFRQFIPLLALAGLLDLAIWSENPLLLYPLALLSAAGLLIILILVYAIVWIMVTRRENRFQGYRHLWMALTAGLLTTLVQISLIDAVRFWLTGTWSGFILGS